MGDGRWEMGRWGSRRKKETNEKQGENSSREIARLHSQALTFLFDKLVQKAGLSHTHVSDDDVLEDVGVVVWTSSHLCK